VKREFVRTWVLLLLAAAFGAYWYFVERQRPVGEDKPKEKVFADLDKARIAELRVQPAAGEPVHLVREGEAWRLEQPAAAADPTAVDSLLTSLASLEVADVVSEQPGELAEYGLAQPKLTVEARVEGATEPLKLMLGDNVPAGSGVYARVPTAPRLFTVSTAAETAFAKTPFDLRDRRLVKLERDAVRSVTASGPGGGFALTRAGDDWRVSEPVETLAGRWAVDGLLGTLESLRIDAVAAEHASAAELKRFGLAPPARRVTLDLGEAGSQTLEIGGKTPGDESKYYARAAGSELVGVIPPAVVDDLAKGLDGVRAKRLLDVSTWEVNGFDVVTPQGKRAFARRSEKGEDGFDTQKWSETEPEARELATTSVQDALFQLGGIDAEAFVDTPGAPAAYGLDAPVFKLTLRREGDNKPEQWVELGRKEGAVFARRSGDAVLLKLDATKAEALVKAFAELGQPEPEPSPAGPPATSPAQ